MCFQLKLIRKEVYLSFLLCILLFVSIDILLYNYIVLGKEEDDNNEEDIEDISINELLDNDNNGNNENEDLFDNDDNDNRDSRYEIIEKEDIEDDVPFILPFNAVPFP